MKNLYMIGGTMGIGKTTVSQYLKMQLNNCVFLDGDWCWDMNPWQITDETKMLVIENISNLLNNFIKCSAYDNIIFCWVMDRQTIINNILSRLNTINCRKIIISLISSETALISRLQKDITNGLRNEDILEKSIERMPLYDVLNTIKINVSEKTIRETAEFILKL